MPIAKTKNHAKHQRFGPPWPKLEFPQGSVLCEPWPLWAKGPRQPSADPGNQGISVWWGPFGAILYRAQ